MQPRARCLESSSHPPWWIYYYLPVAIYRERMGERGQDACIPPAFWILFSHSLCKKLLWIPFSDTPLLTFQSSARYRYENSPDSISTRQRESLHTDKLNKPSGESDKWGQCGFLHMRHGNSRVSPAFVSGEQTYLIKNLAKYPFTRRKEVLMGPVRHCNTK